MLKLRTASSQLRQTLAFYLNDTETSLGLAIDLIITELVLLSTAIFVVETYALAEPVRATLNTLNDGILIIFAVEYLVRLWCADDKRRYIFSLYSFIDLLTILPFLVGITDISFIRIFRWFRILRLVRFLEGKSLFGRVSTSKDVIFVRILFTLFAIIFVYSGLIYQVEHPANAANFSTFLDAFYYSVVTMTTVGFGDVTPITEAGRLLTVLMIFTGIALIPWQVGSLVRQWLQLPDQVGGLAPGQLAVPCPQCHFAVHDDDAQFCKICGHQLQHVQEVTG